MKTSIKNWMPIAAVCTLVSMAVACTDRDNEKRSDVPENDTNYIDTRRNTGTDTTHYITGDSAGNPQSRPATDTMPR